LRRAKDKLFIRTDPRRADGSGSFAGWDWVLPDGVTEERADPWDDGRSTRPVRVSLADAERNAKARQAAQHAHEKARRRRPHQAEYGPSHA